MFQDKLGTPRSRESVDSIYAGVVQSLSKQPKWPPCSIPEAIKWVRSTEDKMTRDQSLGMQSVFLAIYSVSGDEWPPLSPAAFAGSAMPGIRKTFGKYVNSIIAEGG
jgi:hypothetical protein